MAVNITNLVLETLSCLSIALRNWKSLKELWENIYTLRPDAVTKNLKVEEVAWELLETAYVPLHILCKSITHYTSYEKLVDTCINALVKAKQQLHLTDLIAKCQPQLTK